MLQFFMLYCFWDPGWCLCIALYCAGKLLYLEMRGNSSLGSIMWCRHTHRAIKRHSGQWEFSKWLELL